MTRIESLYAELDNIRYWQSAAQEEGDERRATLKEAEAQEKWAEIRTADAAEENR